MNLKDWSDETLVALSERRGRRYRLRFEQVADPLKYLLVPAVEIKESCDVAASLKVRFGVQFGLFGGLFRGKSVLTGPHTQRLDSQPVYMAVRSRVESGASWEETGIIDRKTERIRRRGVVDGCRSREELEWRYNKLDSIIEDVSKHGRLRAYREVRPNSRKTIANEILVSIGAKGELRLARGGNHRLAIAKALGVSVPVMVFARHVDWQQKREGRSESHWDTQDLKY